MNELEKAVIAALEPHWRTDCSAKARVGREFVYARWVRCRCGWESPQSEERINVRDMHRIWNGHVAAVVLGTQDAAEAQQPAAVCEHGNPSVRADDDPKKGLQRPCHFCSYDDAPAEDR